MDFVPIIIFAGGLCIGMFIGWVSKSETYAEGYDAGYDAGHAAGLSEATPTRDQYGRWKKKT